MLITQPSTDQFSAGPQWEGEGAATHCFYICTVLDGVASMNSVYNEKSCWVDE